MEENIKTVRSRDYVRSYEMKVAIMAELEGEQEYYLMDQIALAPEVKEVQRRELEVLYLKIKQIAQVTGKRIDSRLIESVIMQTNFTKKRKRKKPAGHTSNTNSMDETDIAMTQKSKAKENPHPELVIEGTTLVRYNNEEQLTEVTIPHEITDIAKEAFLNADITKVNIPATVKTIGAGAFRNCANLSEIKIPGSVKRIEDYTFSGCKSLRIAFLVYGVEYIGKYAFMEATSLKMINLSKSLKMIDEGAFYGAGLVKAVIPQNMTLIEEQAFRKCPNLKNVVVSGSVKQIGGKAFADCHNLMKVALEDGIGVIGKSCFRNCSRLKILNVPDTVMEIGRMAFAHNENMAVSLPQSLKNFLDTDWGFEDRDSEYPRDFYKDPYIFEKNCMIIFREKQDSQSQ